MKIKKINVLRGPNIWSIRRELLIHMILDLEEIEHFPTNKISGFYERIKQLLPSLYSHRCSEGVPGGFFIRIKEGTWMGHVIEHIALEIQTLAGMDTGFGRTRETYNKGVYHVVFNYIDEEVGVYAAKTAVKIAEALIEGTHYNLEPDLVEMKRLYENNRLGPSTQSIVDAAIKRGIPFYRKNNRSLVQLGYGANQKVIEATITNKTGYIAVESAGNKQITKEILQNASIPVPFGICCASSEGIEQAIREVGFPMAVKPLDGHQGKGACVNLKTRQEVELAFVKAQKYSKDVIFERFIEGEDYRILIIDHKVVAAAKRIPAHIVGDGIHTVIELVELVNTDPLRGKGHEKMLTKIKIDEESVYLLSKEGFSLNSIPERGKYIFLKSGANLSTGGTAIDVTDIIHCDIKFIAERISYVMGMDICGVDLISTDITKSLKETGGAVLEVNAAPGFRMHLSPTVGSRRDVGEAVVKMLFPEENQFSIPIISVTGTNGKTTTSRLIAFIAEKAGFKVGLTTSDGIYIHGKMLEKGDTTGPLSAKYVLKDPTVNFAVLETARGGIIREGLGFKNCDIGIVTNITNDHLGMNEINTLEDLSKVKAVVVESVKTSGWAILNAEDSYCMKVAKQLDCNKAYFFLNQNVIIENELAFEDTVLAFCENGYLSIRDKGQNVRISKIEDIPLSIDGTASFMVQNILAAILACYLQGISVEIIQSAVKQFVPGPKFTPGRINIFEFQNFKVMIDFAHNPAGYKAIGEMLKQVEANRKIGIIAGVGDRRNEDIIKCGELAAEMFDYIIIRQERHLRGRTAPEIVELLLRGMHQVKKDVSFEVIPKEIEAIKHAIDIAGNNDFIVALTDVVENAIEIVQQYKENEIAEK